MVSALPEGGARVVTEYLDEGCARDISFVKDGLAGDETVLLHIAARR